MENKITDIQDPNTPVVLFIYFKNAHYMSLKMSVECARKSILEWKKFMLFSYTPLEYRSKNPEDQPFFLYHFLEGSTGGNRPIMASVCFNDVCGINYMEIPPDPHHQEKTVKIMEKMTNLMEKQVNDETHGEDWRKGDQEK